MGENPNAGIPNCRMKRASLPAGKICGSMIRLCLLAAVTKALKKVGKMISFLQLSKGLPY